MAEGYFAGDFEGLKIHWEDEQRAEKFKSGGTRSKAVQIVMKRLNVDIHQHSWLDTGTGAGFIQTQVDPDADPVLFVGLDFSNAMIRSQREPYGSLIIGSSFDLPFRAGAFAVISNFFSLSDYPEPRDAFKEFSRVMENTGNLYFVDYAKGDEYWELRRQAHGKTGNDDKMIIGDINLRTLEDSIKLFDSNLRVVHDEILSINAKSANLNSNIELPKEIVRKFLFIQAYKPKSKA